MNAKSEIGVWKGRINSEPGKALSPLNRVRQGAWEPSVSEDGIQMVFNKLEGSGNWDVWLKDLRTEAEIPLAVSGDLEMYPKISPDGQRVAYAVRSLRGIRVWSRSRAEPQIACEHCFEPWAWSSDGRYLLVRTGEIRQISAVEFGASPGEETVYEWPGSYLEGSRFSPDDHWVAFDVHKGEVAKVFVAPFRGRVPVPRSEWAPLTVEDVFAMVVGWSQDGRSLYYFSDRDGFRCLWAQRVDARTKKPIGSPVEVYPIHRPFGGTILRPGALGAAMTHDSLYFSMGELQGDIWMLKR